jgi:Glycosyl hydrolase family 20, catalytic domain
MRFWNQKAEKSLPRQKRRSGRIHAFLGIGTILIYLLFHSMFLFEIEDQSQDVGFVSQRSLRDKFIFERIKKVPKSVREQIRRRQRSVLERAVRRDNKNEEEEEYEARMAEQGFQEVEKPLGDDEIMEMEKVKSEGIAAETMEESEERITTDEAPRTQLRGKELTSEVKQSSTRIWKGKIGSKFTWNNTSFKKPKVFGKWEAPIQSTPDDPDGLQQKLATRWAKAQCNYDASLAPPKIQLDEPLISSKFKAETQIRSGVLIDAARHFFPLPWLYGLVDFLSVLGFDLIHFRLTDDQSFVVKLNCHPSLKVTAHFNRSEEYYTAQDLRDWVLYAKQQGIEVMPEINVPGHAGGWSGIPGMLFPCPTFICTASYSIPLRFDEPKVLQIIEDVLSEVLYIFDSPPFLHLGGDEIWMSDPCFTELQIRPDFQAFEDALLNMLQRLNVDPKKVVRWEITKDDNPGAWMAPRILRVKGSSIKRAGEITHWWYTSPLEDDVNKPNMISTDLYFDTSDDSDAWDIGVIAVEKYDIIPLAVISATFELGPCSFNIRNVWGKLIAVAMSTSKSLPQNREEFMTYYGDVCLGMGMPEDVCNLQGRPAIPTMIWKQDHSVLKEAWSAAVCDRLTYPATEFAIRKKDTASRNDDNVHLLIAQERASSYKLQRAKVVHAQSLKSVKDPLHTHTLNYSGVMIDLAHNYFPIDEIHHIIDTVSILGFNLMHIRLIENKLFPIKLLEYGHLTKIDRGGHYYTESELRDLVRYSAERGIQLIPEINVMNNAGGWHESGLLTNCPNYICDGKGPIPLDHNKARVKALITIVCGTIFQIFSTSPFLHLGSVDFDSVEPCFHEAYPLSKVDMNTTYINFEEVFSGVLEKMGIKKSSIIAWEGSKRNALSGITHYTINATNNAVPKEPFFQDYDVSKYNVAVDNSWKVYQQVRRTRNPKALGFIVGTKEMTLEDMKSRNLIGQLIAISAGLSSLEEMDQAKFQVHFASACTKLRIASKNCSSLHQFPLKNDWLLDVTSRAKSLSEFQCSKFTNRGITRRVKESVFGKAL